MAFFKAFPRPLGGADIDCDLPTALGIELPTNNGDDQLAGDLQEQRAEDNCNHLVASSDLFSLYQP